jgi:hypothetical protein
MDTPSKEREQPMAMTPLQEKEGGAHLLVIVRTDSQREMAGTISALLPVDIIVKRPLNSLPDISGG